MATRVKFEVDRKSDILYISLGLGEPSYCEEFDDAILVERGIHSDLITGFRVLDISKYRKGRLEWSNVKGMVKAMLIENTHLADRLAARQTVIQDALRRVDSELDAVALK